MLVTSLSILVKPKKMQPMPQPDRRSHKKPITFNGFSPYPSMPRLYPTCIPNNPYTLHPLNSQLPSLIQTPQLSPIGPNAYSNPLPLLNQTHIQAPTLASSKSVPAFLNKLFNMVNDCSTDSMIKWAYDGRSFVGEYFTIIFKSV